MRLSSLEIKGFKSFADKTVIRFNENLTGIVGPNGCGKSNTVDAIRWVLGEQKSKMLRLEKMDNVIFNGTKKRKPAGRAEVQLTFENTRNLLPVEFGTVTVGRTLYRTGESEYRLNNVRCRLKDISNLFLDTGVSSDSYAIIELAMIGNILDDKDNSRRKLFEQAAGISKFKTRKRQTLLKLKATDADLDRVEDLLFEIEGNLKKLSRQAKRTEKYYKFKAQYKELSIELALHKLVHHKQSFETLQKRQTEESDRKLQIETQINTLEAQLAAQKTEVIKFEKQLAASQKQLNDHLLHLQNTENQKSLATQNIRHLRERCEQLQRQTERDKQLKKQLHEESDYHKRDLENEKLLLEQVGEQLQTLKTEADQKRGQSEDARAQLNQLRKKSGDIERQIFESDKQIAVKTARKDNFLREINDNNIRFQSRRAELDELTALMGETRQKSEQAAQQLQQVEAEKNEAETQLQQQNRQLDEINGKLGELNRSTDALNNEYRLTKSLVDSLEGFPDSVKYLKKSTQHLPAETPLLLDIINCEDAYKPAIENHLKTYLNYFVVPDVEAALTALQSLGKAKKGKAGFFILSELEGKGRPAANAPASPLPDAVRALDILNTSPQYEALIHRLLHNVFVVDDSQLQQPLPEDSTAVLVSKSGHIQRRNAAISGGSVGAYEGKRIGQRQRLKELEKLLSKQKKQAETQRTKLDEVRKSISQLKEVITSKSNWVNHHWGEHNRLQNRLTAYQTKIENSQSFIEEHETRTSGLGEHIAELEAEISQLHIQSESLKAEHANALSQQQKGEAAFNQASERYNQAGQAFNAHNIELHKQQNRIQSVQAKLEFKQNRLVETTRQLQQNETELQSTGKMLSEAEKALAGSDADLKGLYDKKETLEKSLQQIETQYYDARGNTDELEQQLKVKTKNAQNCELLINETKEQIMQLKMQLMSLKERLDIEFKVNIDNLLEQSPSEEWTREQLEAETARLQQKIERYGDINPLAVEAYNEMKERFDFIDEQRNDLLSAKESLLETINEIEDTATEKFMTAFNQVRDNFTEVFRSLFTPDDTCDLILSDPNDPLESSIDITAKPKGKRPQSINQLSGGEKSLTALALVFALYLLKPAPFCILDEVDAPLDDANIAKFSNIIRKFSNESQFIVVTHNKSTMASVDVIYGISMQEEGVSQVIPADFRSLEDWSLSSSSTTRS